MSDWRRDDAWPDVDVVMPVLNEADHLETAVGSIRAQAYAGTLRIFLGVGPSTDGTEVIAARLAADSDDVVVVPNPSGRTPAALNRAIECGAAPVVVRVDGHSELSAGYVRRAVSLLRTTGAANVGGLQRPTPTTPFEEAVADATTSWLGTGGASYRTGADAGPVDTVYLGVFDRAAIEAVGLFDERLIRNQDYELNIRLRESGQEVWFDPTLSVGYRPRPTWRRFARQYFEYGWWKAVVLRKHPGSLKLRQFVPPVAIGAVVASSFVGLRWRPALAVPVAYLATVVAASGRRPRTAVALVTLHGAWSLGIAASFMRRPAPPT
ncbi:MAG: glycosyltransferase family 2 protein [Ilumatobacter sp.]